MPSDGLGSQNFVDSRDFIQLFSKRFVHSTLVIAAHSNNTVIFDYRHNRRGHACAVQVPRCLGQSADPIPQKCDLNANGTLCERIWISGIDPLVGSANGGFFTVPGHRKIIQHALL
ncbi:hypothetical protein T12_3185 [Trichinella patagoniensis]|uniref:Uncharacterized protein n=1 Tax=Trichinella patagoniensis TaxID=990121 RepID=A0A0V1A730_9BILA|nr:hypothetical protein T12_3185 [Trichinella patagoniensis]